MTYYVGLDLGGTYIKAGVVDDHGQVLANNSRPTNSDQGPEPVIQATAQAIAEVVQQGGLTLAQIRGIGIGSPGPINVAQGMVVAAPNLPGWTNVPLRDRIAQAIGRPAILENDANAAALGELWVGAGRDQGVRHLVMLTLGTGVGSGLIMDGRVIHGGWGMAGEVGHLIIEFNGRLCNCGQRGCLEAYASASSTVRRAVEALATGEPSRLRRYLDGGHIITAKDVFDEAKAGDALALRIADQTATYLGAACVSLCHALDPQMIVFAGGMIQAGSFLFDRIRAAFRAHYWRLTPPTVQIVPAQLGSDAGFIGAAAVAWDADCHGQLGS